MTNKQLRRINRRLRWKKGNYRLNQIGTYAHHPSIRRDVVRCLLRTRQWRLAATVALMPNGYSLKLHEPASATASPARVQESTP